MGLNATQFARPVSFRIVGGFLGAGKTATLLRPARAYVEKRKPVGIVTNEQAGVLVDSERICSLRSRLPGGAFVASWAASFAFISSDDCRSLCKEYLSRRNLPFFVVKLDVEMHSMTNVMP
ncbi:MAG: CobW-like GTP-binding protein [Chromatiaceae bacterium]|nr:CobW-like GTP-binding protein [Chromatiaceae bacterium]